MRQVGKEKENSVWVHYGRERRRFFFWKDRRKKIGKDILTATTTVL
jgi:hypothetical protein